MPKAEPSFDSLALLSAVQQQDVGLSVSTNNPVRFRAILYAAMRAAEHLRCYIYSSPHTPRGFYLVKKKIEEVVPVEEPVEEEE